MAFRFEETKYEGERHSHSGGDWYEISPAGVLVVHYANESRGVDVWAPNAWVKLNADQPPGPTGTLAPAEEAQGAAIGPFWP